MLEIKVTEVISVDPHPDADRLTLNTLANGAVCISSKLENGEYRYDVGNLVVYVPERAIVPTWLLKRQQSWNYEKDKGTLAGSKGNRVKPFKMRGVVSEGMLVQLEERVNDGGFVENILKIGYPEVTDTLIVINGEDVGSVLGITEYIPNT